MTNAHRLTRAVLRLYPRAWRHRYEDEVLALLDQDPPGYRAVVDLTRGLFRERLAAAVRWRPGEAVRLGTAGIVDMFALLGLGVCLALMAVPAAARSAALGLQAGGHSMTVLLAFALAAPLRSALALMARHGKNWRWTLIGGAELALWCVGFFVWCVASFLPHATTTGLVSPVADQPLFFVALRGTQLQLLSMGTRRQFRRAERLQALRHEARAALRAEGRRDRRALDLP